MRFLAIVFIFCSLVFIPQIAFANIAPVANTSGPYKGATGTPVLFNGSTSFDADGDPLTYVWNFGDETIGFGVSPSHAYAIPGTYIVSLVVNDEIEDSFPSTSSAIILIGAPISPIPTSGAPTVSLPLILNWEDVLGAQSYYYQIIDVTEEILVTVSESGELSEEKINLLVPQYSYQWYVDTCNATKGSECTNEELQTFLAAEQKQYWHVKSCEDTEGIICGPYREIWNFTFLLLPPSSVSFSPTPGATNVSLPVTLDWDDVIGARSYQILALPCLPWLAEEECFRMPVLPKEDVPPLSEFQDDICFFTRGTYYAWVVESCIDKEAAFCGLSSNQADFQTTNTPALLSAPVDLKTIDQNWQEIQKISRSSILSWSGPSCAYLYEVRLERQEDNKITEFFTVDIQSESVSMDEDSISRLQNFWNDPTNLNKTFFWTVTPCWQNLIGFGIDCETSQTSDPGQFTTTGEAPILLLPENNSFTKVPLALSWEDMGGTSYVYELSSALGVKTDAVQKTKVEIGYEPGLVEPGQEYSWKVKTCVDTKEEVENKVCGEWSETRSFIAQTLNLPAAPINPLNKGQFTFPGSLIWQADPGASFYQYQISYASLAPEETLEGCAEKVGTLLFQPPFPITQSTSLPLDKECTGGYSWAVRSCADSSCEFATNWQETQWVFTAQRGATEGGLVPCGRTTDNPTTPYKEYESCGFKHAGFLLQNILDFVLWKVSLIVLAILAVFVGASTYFSFGSPDVLTRIRSIFRSYFYGVLILLFAWLIVNIIMSVFGFNVEFFGNWYEIPF